MCVQLHVATALEQEEPNWLALTDDEVFDLYHAIADEPYVSDIAFRLFQMLKLKPSLVTVN